MNEIDGAPGTIRTSDPQIRSLMVRQRGRRSKDHECVLPALAIAIRPICTPQLPSGHTRALYFFLAGGAYDLITAGHHGSGKGINRRKMPHVVKAVARTEACAAPVFNILCKLFGWLAPLLFDAHLGVSPAR